MKDETKMNKERLVEYARQLKAMISVLQLEIKKLQEEIKRRDQTQ